MISGATVAFLMLLPLIPYFIAIQILIGTILSAALLFLIVGYRGWARGDTAARYYCMAWSILLATMCWSILDKFGIFPRLVFIEITQLGGIIEVFLLSLALAEKINTEKRVRLQTQRKLAYEASHDALIGLINRLKFERRLERVLDTAGAGQSEHALCYLDLDQFKVVNDTCGQVAGDELLSQVGQLLQQREES